MTNGSARENRPGALLETRSEPRARNHALRTTRSEPRRRTGVDHDAAALKRRAEGETVVTVLLIIYRWIYGSGATLVLLVRVLVLKLILICT